MSLLLSPRLEPETLRGAGESEQKAGRSSLNAAFVLRVGEAKRKWRDKAAERSVVEWEREVGRSEGEQGVEEAELCCQ